MVTITVANGKKESKGVVRRYSNGVWQGSVYHKGGRYHRLQQNYLILYNHLDTMLVLDFAYY